MTALVVPGVRVEATFDPVPPPPSPAGILGLVGVVDRRPNGLVGLTSTTEIATLLGPGTLSSMPELADALRNGASEVVVSAVDDAAAGTGKLRLKDRDGDDVVELRARSAGPWADQVEVRVDEVLSADGRSVRAVDVTVYVAGVVAEVHRNLVLDPRIPERDLFQVINLDSTTLVALDAALLNAEPTVVRDGGAFANRQPARAQRVLTAGNAPTLRLTARNAGERGNQISAQVLAGRAAAVLTDAAAAPTIRVTSREVSLITPTVTVAAGSVPNTVTVTVIRGTQDEVYADLASVGAVVAALGGSEFVRGQAIDGGALPAAATTPLAATRTLVVRVAGADDVLSEDRLTVDEVVAGLAGNAFVDATILASTGAALDTAAENSGFLTGGRGREPVVRLADAADRDVAEIGAAPDVDPAGWVLRLTTTSSGFRLSLDNADGTTLERHEDLTTDPDSDRYLVAVLGAESERIRAFDLYTRAGVTELPAATAGRRPLSASAPPPTAAYLAAIDALAADERIDLLAASLQVFDNDALDVRQVDGALRAFAEATADRGVPAIAFGSVGPAEDQVAEILDHANSVRSPRFVLCAPYGTHAAVAGLVGRLDVFRSPTFKGVPQLRTSPGHFRESELRRLVDPVAGNVLVVQQHPTRGVIVVKGVATNGWQINVTRTADQVVRDVKRIAEGFIGELNDEANRTALGQQVTSFLLRLERDGAIVPSADGRDPAFESRVYATPLDFAQGIVRIDLAVRPVRAVDYVYARLRVKAM
ncbi:phage tail sheath C-terminal domain-containing protein [Frankia sp. QA3]|uniref:phage tail sheath C-terminal domain-containing protein n=1 Tax=Frankia sp. QA3 TaxID=710111 RepID=UPI000269BC85|nr:phage tail sheath C-terminal domain-containing protein [Frankia sp. QA3]EIV92699.1 Phage tail sheath protein [Frankia sp. QA3]